MTVFFDGRIVEIWRDVPPRQLPLGPGQTLRDLVARLDRRTRLVGAQLKEAAVACRLAAAGSVNVEDRYHAAGLAQEYYHAMVDVLEVGLPEVLARSARRVDGAAELWLAAGEGPEGLLGRAFAVGVADAGGALRALIDAGVRIPYERQLGGGRPPEPTTAALPRAA